MNQKYRVVRITQRNNIENTETNVYIAQVRRRGLLSWIFPWKTVRDPFSLVVCFPWYFNTYSEALDCASRVAEDGGVIVRKVSTML